VAVPAKVAENRKVVMYKLDQLFREFVRNNFPEDAISGKEAEFQSDLNKVCLVYICDSSCSTIYVDKPIDIAKTYCSDCGRHFVMMEDAR
jgi:hypothetical protein